MDFNIESKKPQFISKPNPIVPKSYQIFHFKEEKDDYEPVGDYLVIDDSEDADISAKKVTNLIALMNGRKPLIDFKNLTNQRVLFTLVDTDEASTHDKVLFRVYDGSGVSKENAVLTIEKGVFNDGFTN